MLEESAEVEGKWICPTPLHRPENKNAKANEGRMRKQVSNAGQGGRQYKNCGGNNHNVHRKYKKYGLHANKTLYMNAHSSTIK